MQYEAKKFDNLLELEGFGDSALNTHFTLYEGYVNNTDKLLEKLEAMRTENKLDTPEYAELQRRLGWEFNGMRLHEYYFGSLSRNPKPIDPNSALAKKLVEDFGSLENWEKDFRAVAGMRGIGWGILYYDRQVGRLINFWVNEHHIGHPAGLEPILNIDVFEHAYILDYGTKRAGYIDAFMKAVDWNVVQRRFG